VTHRLEYLVVATIAVLVRLLPISAVRACGAAIGRIAYVADVRHRRIAVENLAAAFPAQSEADRRAVVRAVFAHFGRLLLELLKFGAMSRDEMLRRVDVEGADRVREAYQQGRGVLFVTGHFGYWEIHAVAHGAPGNQPLAVVARPLDNPLLERMLDQIRRCTGNTVIYRQGALRKILRALAANQGVALLIDQHLITPDVVYVDFFQRPAATTSALGSLALRTGAPVIPVFALPLPRGRYRLVYEVPVPPPCDDSPDAIREFTQRCTNVLEMYVRRNPELWLWMHRRWREPDRAEPTSGAPLADEVLDVDA
jgi:KDO2-lipid IV(A) lauroyltransferase